MKKFWKLCFILACFFLFNEVGQAIEDRPSWSKILKNYDDILEEGLSCTYNFPSSATEKITIKKITINATQTSIYVNYNDSVDATLISSSQKNSKNGVVDEHVIYQDVFAYGKFLDKYKNNGNKCPDSIQLAYNINEFDYQNRAKLTLMYDGTPTDGSRLINFKTNASSTAKDPDGNSCYLTTATECRRYQRDRLPNGTLYIEFGKENTQTYFAVSYDSDFSNAAIGNAKNGYSAKLNIGDVVNIYDPSILDSFPSTVYIKCTAGPGNNIFAIDKTGPDNLRECDYNLTPWTPDGSGGGNTPVSPDPLDIKDLKFCEESGVLKAFQIIGYALFIMKILVPLILIGMGIYDFSKAAISSDDKSNKEAMSSLIRRCIIAVIIFFIPTVLNFALTLIDEATEKIGNDSQFSKCTSCLFDPNGKCSQ